MRYSLPRVLGSMRKKYSLLIFFFIFLTQPLPNAIAQWSNLFKGLAEVNIQHITANPRNPDILFVASEKNIYRSTDAGESWKKVHSVRGDNYLKFLYVDKFDPEEVYAGTSNGIRISKNNGDKWSSDIKANFAEKNEIYFLTNQSANSQFLWVGTGKGLYVFNKANLEFTKINSFPDVPAFSMAVKSNSIFLISSDKGIYQSANNGESWNRVTVETTQGEEEADSTTLSQFDIEELTTNPMAKEIAFIPQRNIFMAASSKGLLESNSDSQSWSKIASQNLPVKYVRTVEAADSTFYAGTSNGIFRWDFDKQLFEDLSDGLESKDIQDIYYDANANYLLVATKKGLYKYAYPEISLKIENPELNKDKVRQIMEFFKNEPTISQVQAVAIEYAEVHPRKIEEWRRAAAKKAWMPKVSLNQSINTDQNIDLDRGGTADPDRYIQGPNTRNRDWSVDVSWDLGELVWNADQTSIDTRSRLMVELRDDVLTEVTHLFYERRRLQIDMLVNPPKELPTIVEKQLKLDELTANLDALTGSLFSKKLAQKT